ncbi:MAG: hypothetical protein QM681_00210 [Novosphingobium sp.]
MIVSTPRMHGRTGIEVMDAASGILLGWLLDPNALALYRMIVADTAQHPGQTLTVDGAFQPANEAIATILADREERSAETVRLGADTFVRLVAGEALDRAARGLVPARPLLRPGNAPIGGRFLP